MEDTLTILDNIAEVNYTTGEARLTLQPTETALCDLLKQNFSGKGHITVALSGGLDSQFSANVAKHYADSMSVVTFRHLWDGSVINGQDVATAQNFCEKAGIDFVVEDFDVKHLLSAELMEYCNHYRSISPHITTQLAAIKRSQHIEGTLLLGGEAPIVGVDPDGNVRTTTIPGVTNDNPNTVPTHFVFTHYAPFEFLHIHNGIEVIRDPFWISPDTLYAAYMHNIHTMQTHKSAFYLSTNDMVKSSTTQYKINFYTSINKEFVFVPPLFKQTGFEPLNMYLASQTGNYDEFDLRYRQPILKNIFSTDWASPTMFDEKTHTFRKAKTTVEGAVLADIEAQLTESVADITLQENNSYHFNW